MLCLYRVIAICVCLLCFGAIAQAETAAPPTLESVAQENARLRQEVEALQKLLQDHIKPQQGAPADQTLMERVDALEKALPAGKSPLLSSVKAELYGYIKLDASYDTSRITPGNYAFYANSEAGNKQDNEFNMTANETRVGLNLTGPQVEDMVTSGKIEFDFYGGGAETENKPNPMLRHALMKLDWAEEGFSILAGQTSDIISPLVPSTLNYSVGWEAGNIGYRRPQVQLTKTVDLDGSQLTLQGGVARTIGDTTGFDPGDSGEDAGFPTVEGRAALAFPLLTSTPTVVGVSGHFGQEEYDTNAADKHVIYHTWSGNVDLTMPLVQKALALRGEAFTGDNLDTFLGGIRQGINTPLHREITSRGGWAAVTYTPPVPWEFNLGAGVDDPSNADLRGIAAARTKNTMIFGNAIYKINKAASVGLELSKWSTDYIDRADGDALRAETAFKYAF